MKILVVDDDHLVLKAVEHCLRLEQFDVVTADNCFEALKHIESGDLSLIICDIMMPGMSGLELLSLLKQFHFYKIPIIIISILTKAQIEASSLGLGAQSFFTKPLDYSKLVENVKELMANEIH